MSEVIQNLIQSLGHSCHAESTGDGSPVHQSSAKNSLLKCFQVCQDDEERCKMVFPSFSLDTTSDRDKGESQSREAVQMQASAMLSQPIIIDGNEPTACLEDVPRLILENLYSSFDRLVDARILAYSKILGSHGLTLAASHRQDAGVDAYEGTKVLEYKLKTLLEIGTNIYADSVTTSFSFEGDTNVEKKDDITQVSAPIVMKVEIKDLHVPCTDSGRTSSVPVCFSAPGLIKGEFCMWIAQFRSG